MTVGARPDIVVVGGANYDYLIRGRDFPEPGATSRGDVFDEAPGGKGANQAIAAARLGARVDFIGRVGDDDRGRRVLARLRDEQIGTGGVVVDADAATGVALIMVRADGEKMIMTASGANRRLDVADVERMAGTVTAARVLLLQLEAETETVLAALRLAHRAGVRVVLDAAPPRPLPDELFPMLTVFRANGGEARAITGVGAGGVDGARAAAREVLRRGAAAACISADGGDLLVTADGETWLPHQAVEVVDATGAGDAFAAGLAVGLAEDRPLADAARLGCAAAALKTTRLGAQAGLPTRSEVERFLATLAR